MEQESSHQGGTTLDMARLRSVRGRGVEIFGTKSEPSTIVEQDLEYIGRRTHISVRSATFLRVLLVSGVKNGIGEAWPLARNFPRPRFHDTAQQAPCFSNITAARSTTREILFCA